MNKVKMIIAEFVGRFRNDRIGLYASQAAYFTILSAFPFAIFMLSIIQYTPLSYNDLLNVLQSLIPGVSADYIDSMLLQIYERSTIAITSFTILFVLWSAGRAIFSLTNGLNEIYQLKETRNYFHLRFNAMIYTMLLAIALIPTMMVLLFGKQVFSYLLPSLPFHQLFIFMISIRLIIIFLLLTLLLILIYKILPNTYLKTLSLLPGASGIAIAWIITTYICFFLFSYTNSFSNMYGSLAGIMVIMMWLFFCFYELFVGAELNHIMSHGTRRGDSLNDIIDSRDPSPKE